MGAGEVEAEGPDQCVIVPASIQRLFSPVILIIDCHHAAPDEVLKRAAHGIFVKGGIAHHRFCLAAALPRQCSEYLSLNQVCGFIPHPPDEAVILSALRTVFA
jgi:hypothetical protein